MKLHQLTKTTSESKKRVGRGLGSGKGGHTSGRGQKGQKSRGKISPTFEGTKIKKSLLKRIPVLRGKGKFKTHRRKPVTLDIKKLSQFSSKSTINLENLKKAKLVSRLAKRVKIVGKSKLSVPLLVTLPTTKSARAMIEKAGGKITS